MVLSSGVWYMFKLVGWDCPALSSRVWYDTWWNAKWPIRNG